MAAISVRVVLTNGRSRAWSTSNPGGHQLRTAREKLKEATCEYSRFGLFSMQRLETAPEGDVRVPWAEGSRASGPKLAVV
jgi:hypothetical protein